jgi:hypothetical protein
VGKTGISALKIGFTGTGTDSAPWHRATVGSFRSACCMDVGIQLVVWVIVDYSKTLGSLLDVRSKREQDPSHKNRLPEIAC